MRLAAAVLLAVTSCAPMEQLADSGALVDGGSLARCVDDSRRNAVDDGGCRSEEVCSAGSWGVERSCVDLAHCEASACDGRCQVPSSGGCSWSCACATDGGAACTVQCFASVRDAGTCPLRDDGTCRAGDRCSVVASCQLAFDCADGGWARTDQCP